MSWPFLIPITVRMFSRRPDSQAHQCLVGSGVTQTATAAFNNNHRTITRSGQPPPPLSRQHYPASSNYSQYDYGNIDDTQSRQNGNPQQQSHRNSMPNNNYPGTMYQQQSRSSPQGPYITQVTIRDNQHVIQSPNI